MHKTATTLNPHIISPHYDWQEGQFTISGFSLKNIMRYADASAAYIFDGNTVRHYYKTLRNALPSRVEFFYAMKANPSLAVSQLLITAGTGLDITSYGELLASQKLGVSSDKIAYTAPVKNERDIAAALHAGIYLNIESFHEAQVISRLAGQLGIDRVPIGLRVNPDFHITEAHLILSGNKASKFGVDQAAIPALVRKLHRLPHILLNGLHVSVASGVLSASALIAYYEACFELATQLAQYFPIERIDMGGGFGIPYFYHEKALDVVAVGEGLQTLIKRYPSLNSARLIVEPGRYLVGQAGIYVCTVDHVKQSHGQKLAMIDGGIHHYSRPAFTGQASPMANLANQNGSQAYDVADKTATSVGYLGKSVQLSQVSAGDYIGIFNAGAYGLSQSTHAFLSHEVPPELLIWQHKVTVIRQAKTAQSYLDGQLLLETSQT